MATTAVAIFARNPWGTPIRAAQGFGAFSHVASVVGNGVTIEALAFPGQVVVRDLPNLRHRSTYVEALTREVTDDQAAARADFLTRAIGTTYDYLGAVGAAWMGVRQWQSPARWYCSELEIAANAHAGLLTVSPYLRGITPMQAHYLMTAAGWRPVDLQNLI
jgi:uncharacterized protein YycO